MVRVSCRPGRSGQDHVLHSERHRQCDRELSLLGDRPAEQPKCFNQEYKGIVDLIGYFYSDFVISH